MTIRDEKIIKAAGAVFLRYGFKRATMNDIAQEAAISRQTLYNSFANKDEVLRGAIRKTIDETLAAIEADCAKAASLEEALESLFQHMVIKPYEFLTSSPHAEEFLEGLSGPGRSEVVSREKDYRALIEKILEPEKDALIAKGLAPDRVAELIYVAGKATKNGTTSRQHLKTRVETLKLMILDLTATT